MKRPVSAFALFAILLSGCGGAAKRVELSRALPFTVHLAEIRAPQPKADAGDEKPSGEDSDATPGVPAVFSSNRELMTRRLAEALSARGLFVRVVAEERAEAPADLVMEVEIRGEDFGAGEIMAGGAAASTTVWLFAGPISWMIDDRQYPDSAVTMDVALRRPAGNEEGGQRPLFQDRLFLKGLTLDFFERAESSDYLINILLPPWWGDGTPSVAGESLARKSLEHFVEREPDQILTRLPALYFESVQAFLVHLPEERAVVVISRPRVVQVGVTSGLGGRREIDPDALALLEVADEAEKDALQLGISSSVVGIGTENRYYRIPLLEGEQGYVRIEALLEAGREAGPWTVRG